MTLRFATLTPNILSVTMPWRAYILRVCSLPFFFSSAMMAATLVMLSSFSALRDIGLQPANDAAAASTGGNTRLNRLHVLAANLQIETVWILDVKTVLG